MSCKHALLSKSVPSTRNGRLSNTSADKPKMLLYIGFFAVGYMLASAIFMMVQTKFALNPQLVTVLSIMLGAYIAVNKFIKHQQRALHRDEINRLMFGGVIVVWLLTMVYFLGIWLF